MTNVDHFASAFRQTRGEVHVGIAQKRKAGADTLTKEGFGKRIEQFPVIARNIF